MGMRCSKVKYGTKGKAHIAARTIMRSGKTLRAYACKNCGGFHLTSDTRGLRRYEK